MDALQDGSYSAQPLPADLLEDLDRAAEFVTRLACRRHGLRYAIDDGGRAMIELHDQRGHTLHRYRPMEALDMIVGASSI